MNKKETSMIIGAIVAAISALGIGGYSISASQNHSPNIERRIERIEDQVMENGKNISTILGYLKGKNGK
jgi:hypothetical protein